MFDIVYFRARIVFGFCCARPGYYMQLFGICCARSGKIPQILVFYIVYFYCRFRCLLCQIWLDPADSFVISVALDQVMSNRLVKIFYLYYICCAKLDYYVQFFVIYCARSGNILQILLFNIVYFYCRFGCCLLCQIWLDPAESFVMSVVLDQVRSHRLVKIFLCIYVFIWLFSLAGMVGVSQSVRTLRYIDYFLLEYQPMYLCAYLFKTDPQHETTYRQRLLRLSLCMPSPGRISDRARASLRFTNEFL